MPSAWLFIPLALLPVAYLSGWWVARRTLKKEKAAAIPQAYFKGINYVLNEQPDKAIAVFSRMLEVDGDAVDIQLALGNLFRRRGEVDRAIRIHQDLVARPTLDRDESARALLELGLDYMRAGLLDRAECLFKDLADSGKYTTAAHEQLLKIYQQQQEWDKAIGIARRLDASSDLDLAAEIAHFYCELSGEHQAQGRHKEAGQCLQRALEIDPTCVRASLMQAEEARRNGEIKTALYAYQRVQQQDADYLPEIIQALLACYRQQNRLADFMEYLRELLQKHGGMTPLLCLTDLIAETRGQAAAVQFISRELDQRPSVRGVDKLLEYTLAQADGETRDCLSAIKALTASLLKDSKFYQCTQCGFAAQSLHWQCPACKNWNSVKPVSGVAGE